MIALLMYVIYLLRRSMGAVWVARGKGVVSFDRYVMVDGAV